MMNYQHGFDAAHYVGHGIATMPPVLFFGLIAWTLVWKGFALWYSAQRKEPLWFVVLLLINTAGILDIIYLFFIAKKSFSDLFPTGKIQ